MFRPTIYYDFLALDMCKKLDVQAPLKYTHIYNTDPTKITKQIEKFTYYPQRKQNLIDEINKKGT